MNLQLKFIVLAFSAFTLVSATSAPIEGLSNDDLGVRNALQLQGDNDKLNGFSTEELAKVANKLLQAKNTDNQDDENMEKLGKELGEVVDIMVHEVGFGGFARKFKRGCGYVFSDDNMTMVGKLLTRVRNEVPLKMLVASGVMFADARFTQFVFENSAQVAVVSVLACYAYMNVSHLTNYLPDFSSYAKLVTTKCGNFIASSISAGIWGKKD